MTCKDVAAWDDAKAVSHFFIARHFSSLSGAFSLNLIRFIPMAGVVYSFTIFLPLSFTFSEIRQPSKVELAIRYFKQNVINVAPVCLSRSRPIWKFSS